MLLFMINFEAFFLNYETANKFKNNTDVNKEHSVIEIFPVRKMKIEWRHEKRIK